MTEADVAALAAELALERQKQLEAWQRGGRAAEFRADPALRVLTPGSTAGEPLHVLSSLERRSASWDADPEAARAAAQRRHLARPAPARPRPRPRQEPRARPALRPRRAPPPRGQTADLGSLLDDVLAPPLERIGALDVDDFLPQRTAEPSPPRSTPCSPRPPSPAGARAPRSTSASGSRRKDGRTPAVIVSVAHLDDDERTLVLGVLLEEVLAWVPQPARHPAPARPGRLRRGLRLPAAAPRQPAHQAPARRAHEAGRAFGVGVVVATQNPMDLDYRALCNAGLWGVGRLQTDADRARVVDSLAHANAAGSSPRTSANVSAPTRPALVPGARRARGDADGAAQAALGDVLPARADDAERAAAGARAGGG